MKLKTSQLYNLIKANNYKSARIFEGLNADVLEEMPFETIFKNSPEELIERIEDLETFLNGDFILVLGSGRKTEPIRQGRKVGVQFIQQVLISKPDNRMNGFETFEPIEDINKKVAQEVARLMKEKEQQAEVEDYKNKIKELDNWSGKLNYLLTQFLNQYLQSLQQVPQMNGTELNGQQQAPIDTAQLDEALSILIKFIGSENIIKFSNKIKNGQAEGVKPLILQFINT